MNKHVTVWEMNGAMNAGGTESLIMELLRNKPENVTVKMIIHSSQKSPVGLFDDEIRKMGIDIHYLPSVGSVGYKAYKQRLFSLVSEIGKPDVIHSHMNAVGGLICKAARECGISARIVHCHADIKYRGSRLSIIKNELKLRVMKIYVNKYATGYWACSVAAARRLFYKNKPFTVIPNVIDVQKYLSDDKKRIAERDALGVPNGAIAIGAVGRVARIKNYETVIDALSILKARGNDAHFYCYGRADDEAYFNELTKRAKDIGVSELVHFLGNSNRVSDAISAFDVFVMPSITEGLGISALEAQAAGIPTVLSNGVPNETDMSLSLVTRAEAKDALAWANAIENSKIQHINHSDILEAFAKKGYDSKTKCADIYGEYIKMTERFK